jgi:hypothetical protein
MNKYLGVLVVSCCLTVCVYAEKIVDISDQDAAYVAISKSVKEGYLPLSSGDLFEGQKSVSRREMAIIIDKLLTDHEGQNLALTRQDIQELKQVLKAYKTYMSDDQVVRDKTDMALAKISNEQRIINRDLGRFQDKFSTELTQYKKEQEEQQKYLWIGIASAALLGLIIH